MKPDDLMNFSLKKAHSLFNSERSKNMIPRWQRSEEGRRGHGNTERSFKSSVNLRELWYIWPTKPNWLFQVAERRVVPSKKKKGEEIGGVVRLWQRVRR